jgi:TRAP-type C4-dicarboxylate transport system permease small subunit
MKALATKVFDFLEVYLPTLIFFVLVITVAIEVFSRYVLNEPTPKLFELTIYSFVWVIYLGATLAKRYNKHIRFDILYRHFPKRVRIIIDTVFDTITNIALLFIIVPCIEYTIWSYNIKASALRIPWSYLLLCFPIFVLLILIHNTMDIVSNIYALFSGKERQEEVPPWL